MTGELWRESALGLAAKIRAGDVSSREVIDAHLARIEAVNPHLNAVVRVLADEARAGADAADQARANGQPMGPLHGVPITVKENIDVAGTPTTSGLVVLADAVAPIDATASARAAIPLVVGVPARSMFSLTVIGTPCSGPIASPLARVRSAASAPARASVASTRTTALR